MAGRSVRDAIGEAIRGEPVCGEPSWERLADERKEPWLADADRVIAALRPFADAADDYADDVPDNRSVDDLGVCAVTVGDLRRARAAVDKSVRKDSLTTAASQPRRCPRCGDEIAPDEEIDGCRDPDCPEQQP